jgi:hypothetical protein
MSPGLKTPGSVAAASGADTRGFFMARHRGKQRGLVLAQRRQGSESLAPNSLRETLDRVQIAKDVVVVKTGRGCMRPSVADRLGLLDPVAGRAKAALARRAISNQF